MSGRYSKTGYDFVINNPIVDSLYFQTAQQNSPSPPPGVDLMITEITEDYMITEGGDFMITEM